jgi:hypothetical protein
VFPFWETIYDFFIQEVLTGPKANVIKDFLPGQTNIFGFSKAAARAGAGSRTEVYPAKRLPK